MTDRAMQATGDYRFEVLTRLADMGERLARIETTLETRKDEDNRIVSLEKSRDRAWGIAVAISAVVGGTTSTILAKLSAFLHS